MAFLTIFTPSYNRAYILTELFDSLIKQSCKDFEWIIVDDASTDNTSEVVKKFYNDEFEIKYIKQEHGGKHRAINLGLKNAIGELFLIVDSDDALTHNAVETIKKWHSEHDKSKANICGFAGLRMYKDGSIIGGNPSFECDTYVEATNLERNKFNLDGDKAEIYFTEILKKYPFPEFEGEMFLTEAIVWNKIATDGYKLKWYNTPIYVCEYLEDGLTKTGANAHIGHVNNINGYGLYVNQLLEWGTTQDKINNFIEFIMSCEELHLGRKKQFEILNISKFEFLKWYLVSILVRGKYKIASELKKIGGKNN